MKNARQARIREIVSESEVCTQQEITDILVNEGFKVTQATVSRDLRELNLKKSGNGGKSRSKYNVSDYVSEKNNLKNKMFESITELSYSMNNVVVKTMPGLAQALASSIDAQRMEGVLGCVAGDDTIIIVTVNEEYSQTIVDVLKKLGRIG